MSFRVQPEALRTTAERLEALGGQAERASEYAEHVHVEGEGSGIFWNVVSTSAKAAEAVKASMSHLATLAEQSGRQVRLTAGHYEHIDAARAAHLDALAGRLDRLPSGKTLPS